MAKTVWAVYESGKLRLLEPVDLRDGQHVRVQVVRVEPGTQAPVLKEEQPAYVAVALTEPELDQGGKATTAPAVDPMDALVQRLVQEGRLLPRPAGPIPPPPLSESELDALADRLGRRPGKTASEMVIEDRGERK